MAPKHEDARPQPRLYLIAPEVADPEGLARPLAAALGAADVAAVLLRLADDAESTLIRRVKTIAPIIQNSGAALILDGRTDIVARSGADGAHLTGAAAFEAAREDLKPDRIAGAGGILTRHDAMVVAEAGADYVMFGEPDAQGRRAPFAQILDRVQWWQEVFQTPCVAFAAALAEVHPLAQAGADFVAVGDFVFRGARPVAEAVAEAAARVKIAETTA
ncbi:MAG TPA: thiamine phosphate synthase [Pseudorhodoplanes sp.]|jgi:thiamine-phosphate pyrophosphorylase|nr:thiamine phosphate synthase [Pseudorhodoplanes sp.]